jgi:glycosyltransferase involved in cell wall biosynthesis
LKILIATDVFPPRCGGAGWSTYYLARALRARGHEVSVVRPRFDTTARQARVHPVEYDGFRVAEAVLPLPQNPLLRLIARNWQGPRLLRRLIAREATRLGADLIHAQHALTVPAAVDAADALARGRARRMPVVGTVRDYWPLCYYNTMQVPRRIAVPGSAAPSSAFVPPRDVPVANCRRLGSLARALRRAQGRRAGRSLPLLPLWQIATARRRRALRRADAVIAVSGFVAELLARGGAVAPDRLHVIPNLVDLPRLEALAAEPPPLAAFDLAPGAPFLLFVGKLEPSKGAQLLPRALQAAGVGTSLPLVVAGSGPLQPWLAEAAQARGLDIRFGAWLDNADVLRLMRAATLLLFPSDWEEPLSRVLLEGCAVGATILALDTGGTPDIIVDGQNGRLVADMDAFAGALRALLADPAQRARLAAGARATARERFSAEVVVAQVEALYAAVVARAAT